MFNHPLFQEEANLKIVEREREAESHRLYSQLGYSKRGISRWVVALIALVIAMVLIMAFL